MTVKKIVCDDKIPFLKGVFEPYAQVLYKPGASIVRADLIDADALIVRTRTRCDAALLEGTSVKYIASATIGFDHIDASYCAQKGIIWANAPGCNAASVCQYVCGVLEVLAHRYKMRLAEKTLGIVGVGNVGSRVEKAARQMGMRVLLCDPPRAQMEVKLDSEQACTSPALTAPHNFIALEELLSESDIITLHVPLNEQTYHMLDAERLTCLSKGQFLLNTSRGEVVDNLALKAVLRDGRIGGAVLDVWENEPDIDTELLALLEIGTPHIAGYSADGKANGTMAAVRFIASSLGIKELQNWEVASLPIAPNPVYDVLEDDARLCSEPTAFEQQRSNYPIRREPLYKKY